MKLQQNAFEFANLKFIQFHQDIENGDAEAIFKKHERYLQAELQHFKASAQMGQKWQGYQKDKDKLPYLQYVTAKDDHVRPNHKVLNGIIQPIDSEFWKTHFPPIGYRCRCTVRRLTKAAAEKDINFGKPIPNVTPDSPLFSENTGITGKAFNSKHPYWNNFELFAVENAKNFADAEANLAKVIPFLNDADKYSIYAWSGNAHSAISRYYLGITPKDSSAYIHEKNWAEQLEKTMKKLPNYYGVSYRGEELNIERFNFLKSLKEKDNFTFGKINSSSFRLDLAELPKLESTLSVTFELHNKNSHYIAPLSSKPAELEFLSPPNSKYEILRVELENDTHLFIKLIEL